MCNAGGPIGADFYCGDHDPSYLSRPEAGMRFPDTAYMWANNQVVNAIKKVLKVAPGEWEAKTAESTAWSQN